MSPKMRVYGSPPPFQARCPHGGGHIVPLPAILIIANPAGGPDLYAGCVDCLVRGIGRIDAPVPEGTPQQRELLVRAIAALTQPMHYNEVGELVRAIRAVLRSTT